QDNCPADPNPNQLDFDDNGSGNVCQPTYLSGAGYVDSTLVIASSLGDCEVPVEIYMHSGQIGLVLDDEATSVGIRVSKDFHDVEVQCSLGEHQLAITIDDNMLFIAVNDLYQVPHSLADHDAGIVQRQADDSAPLLVNGTFHAQLDGNPVESTFMNLAGPMPPIVADIWWDDQVGFTGTLGWDDPEPVIASQQLPLSAEVSAEVSLRGAVGSL